MPRNNNGRVSKLCPLEAQRREAREAREGAALQELPGWAMKPSCSIPRVFILCRLQGENNPNFGVLKLYLRRPFCRKWLWKWFLEPNHVLMIFVLLKTNLHFVAQNIVLCACLSGDFDFA